MKKITIIILILTLSFTMMYARRITRGTVTLKNSEFFPVQIAGKEGNQVYIVTQIDGQRQFLIFEKDNISKIIEGRKTPVFNMVFNDKDWFTTALKKDIFQIYHDKESFQHPQQATDTTQNGVSPTDATPPANQGNIVAAMNNAAQHLMSVIPKNATIAIVNVSSTDTDMSEYVANELEHILVESSHRVVDRNELNRVRAEQAFQLSGEVDDSTIVQIGKFVGADLIITGSITGRDETRRLRLRAINTQTAEVVRTASEPF